MTILRMDHACVVVDDLGAAIAFVVELGMELEGEASIEGPCVDRLNGLDGVRVDIAMMRAPDGQGRLELTKFHAPAAVSAEPENALGNTLGLRSIMFAVDDIERHGRRPANPRRGTRRRGDAVPGQLPALLRPLPCGDHRRVGPAARLTGRREVTPRPHVQAPGRGNCGRRSARAGRVCRQGGHQPSTWRSRDTTRPTAAHSSE